MINFVAEPSESSVERWAVCVLCDVIEECQNDENRFGMIHFLLFAQFCFHFASRPKQQTPLFIVDVGESCKEKEK